MYILNFKSNFLHFFLIKYIPRLSITSIVRKLKQEITYITYGTQFIEIIYTLNFELKKLSGLMVILFVQSEKPIQTLLNNIFCVFFDGEYKKWKSFFL